MQGLPIIILSFSHSLHLFIKYYFYQTRIVLPCNILCNAKLYLTNHYWSRTLFLFCIQQMAVYSPVTAFLLLISSALVLDTAIYFRRHDRPFNGHFQDICERESCGSVEAAGVRAPLLAGVLSSGNRDWENFICTKHGGHQPLSHSWGFSLVLLFPNVLGMRLTGVNARSGSKAMYNGKEFTLRMHQMQPHFHEGCPYTKAEGKGIQYHSVDQLITRYFIRTGHLRYSQAATHNSLLSLGTSMSQLWLFVWNKPTCMHLYICIFPQGHQILHKYTKWILFKYLNVFGWFQAYKLQCMGYMSASF